MGKRKHPEEDYLERKIRSLERKRLKIRRRRRHRSYSPSTSSYTDNEYEYADQDIGEPDPLLEDSQYEESPLTNNTVYDLTDDEVGASTSGALPAAGGLRSVVIQNRSAAGPRAVDAPAPAPPPAPAAAAAPACAPAAATTTPAAPAPAPTSAATTTQVTGEQIGLQESTPIVTALDPGLLCLLGDEPVKEETFGPCIHDDISTRWSDILVNGMKDDIKNDILKRYEIPENLKLAQAPILNPEIKVACNDNVLKRDNILSDKQKLLSTIITGVANTLSNILTTDSTLDNNKQGIIKSLSDTGRLLCHLHFSETQSRRNFLVPSLNKEIKDNIKDLKRDSLLFGKELQESLKSIKAMTKTGAELRPTVTKPKWTPKHQQAGAGPSTSRALNWRGQPSSASRPPPRQSRQTPARTSYTRGGRRPPPPSRRASDRRAPPPRPHTRTSRR
ncbi:uncharacterized protein LOC125227444 [Leguminivora glycinivorella]|uniref:uncharacterized protein LOC125227444 n=1 Tax=Leguminivora glycinivorella TaxID=1035111 RepID=UPI00200DF234|nr:uncharacterized protein LOC125227444 [Leguminivora glycinivorella]